jgi:hypothetical protein
MSFCSATFSINKLPTCKSMHWIVECDMRTSSYRSINRLPICKSMHWIVEGDMPLSFERSMYSRIWIPGKANVLTFLSITCKDELLTISVMDTDSDCLSTTTDCSADEKSRWGARTDSPRRVDKDSNIWQEIQVSLKCLWRRVTTSSTMNGKQRSSGMLYQNCALLANVS